MLTQLRRLSLVADGRYATDAELEFMDVYITSFDLRLSTYLQLQAAEVEMIQEVETKLQALDPSLFMRGIEDFRRKWKADTVRTLRIAAVAMLIDDPERYKERFLYWFQTLMRAFKTQRSCNATYKLLQEAVRQRLAPAQADLICPVLELTRTMLS
jgi:hypothetical protein